MENNISETQHCINATQEVIDDLLLKLKRHRRRLKMYKKEHSETKADIKLTEQQQAYLNGQD